MKKLLVVLLFIVGLVGVAFADSTPTIISFQGQLRENSVPVSGSRTMHFRILDVSNNVIWQSNASLATQVTVAVTNGIYTVGLGDTALTNMAALNSGDLDQNKKLFLRVRVGTEDLSPDILFSAVPFAFIAKQAEAITQNISAGNSVVLALRQATQNVGIGNTNPVNLFQVSTNALVISANGRVGVGTTNIQEQLDVAGRVRLGQTTAPGVTTDKLYNVAGNLFWNGVTLNTAAVTSSSQWTTTASTSIFYTSGNVGIGNNNPANLFQVSVNALVVSSNGFVGVGTTAPSHSIHIVGGKLQVTNTGTSGAVILNRTDGKYLALRAGTAGGFFSFEDTGYFAITKEPTSNLVIGAGGLGNAVLLVDPTGNVGIGNISPNNLLHVSVNAFVVNSNGNVGINTNNPQENLDINGRLRLSQMAAPGVITDKLYNVGGNLFWNGVTLNTVPGISSQWTTTASTSIFYSSGNVGIRTNNPQGVFQVSSNYFVVSANGNIGIADNTPINLLEVSTNYLVVSSNGRVGIGNATPANLFQVSVNALVVNHNGHVGISTTNTTATLVVDGGIVAGSVSVALTADNQLVTVGDRSFIIISSNNGTATNRTFCLTAGAVAGQILYILNTDNGNSAQMIDGAQPCAGAPATLKLNGNYSLGGGGDTGTLIFDGTNWNEISRSAN